MVMRKLACFAALLGLLAGFLGAPAPAVAQDAAEDAGPGPTAATAGNAYVIGAADAPVTVIEYISLTCGFCARFHLDTLPALKTKYIDTGRLRMVVREYPLDGPGFQAAILVRCLDESRRDAFVQLLYERQQSWVRGRDPLAQAKKLARLAGLGAERADACLESDAIATAILETRQAGERDHGVEGTPTFVIGGRSIQDAMTLEEFEEILLPLFN